MTGLENLIPQNLDGVAGAVNGIYLLWNSRILAAGARTALNKALGRKQRPLYADREMTARLDAGEELKDIYRDDLAGYAQATDGRTETSLEQLVDAQPSATFFVPVFNDPFSVEPVVSRINEMHHAASLAGQAYKDQPYRTVIVTSSRDRSTTPVIADKLQKLYPNQVRHIAVPSNDDKEAWQPVWDWWEKVHGSQIKLDDGRVFTVDLPWVKRAQETGNHDLAYIKPRDLAYAFFTELKERYGPVLDRLPEILDGTRTFQEAIQYAANDVLGDRKLAYEFLGIFDAEDLPDRDMYVGTAHTMMKQDEWWDFVQARVLVHNLKGEGSSFFSRHEAFNYGVYAGPRGQPGDREFVMQSGMYFPFQGLGYFGRALAFLLTGGPDVNNITEDFAFGSRVGPFANVGLTNQAVWEEAPTKFGGVRLNLEDAVDQALIEGDYNPKDLVKLEKNGRTWGRFERWVMGVLFSTKDVLTSDSYTFTEKAQAVYKGLVSPFFTTLNTTVGVPLSFMSQGLRAYCAITDTPAPVVDDPIVNAMSLINMGMWGYSSYRYAKAYWDVLGHEIESPVERVAYMVRTNIERPLYAFVAGIPAMTAFYRFMFDETAQTHWSHTIHAGLVQGTKVDNNTLAERDQVLVEAHRRSELEERQRALSQRIPEVKTGWMYDHSSIFRRFADSRIDHYLSPGLQEGYSTFLDITGLERGLESLKSFTDNRRSVVMHLAERDQKLAERYLAAEQTPEFAAYMRNNSTIPTAVTLDDVVDAINYSEYAKVAGEKASAASINRFRHVVGEDANPGTMARISDAISVVQSRDYNIARHNAIAASLTQNQQDFVYDVVAQNTMNGRPMLHYNQNVAQRLHREGVPIPTEEKTFRFDLNFDQYITVRYLVDREATVEDIIRGARETFNMFVDESTVYSIIDRELSRPYAVPADVNERSVQVPMEAEYRRAFGGQRTLGARMLATMAGSMSDYSQIQQPGQIRRSNPALQAVDRNLVANTLYGFYNPEFVVPSTIYHPSQAHAQIQRR